MVTVGGLLETRKAGLNMICNTRGTYPMTREAKDTGALPTRLREGFNAGAEKPMGLRVV